MSEGPTVLVCGGRDFSDRSLMFDTLDDVFLNREHYHYTHADGNWLPFVTIISGGARGADALAKDYAAVNWCSFREYPAQWKDHGRAAGMIRNRRMLDEEQVDLVVAFPGGKGTAHMVKLAKARGIEVIEVEK